MHPPDSKNNPIEITDLDRRLAVPMCCVALLDLMLLGAFLHLTHGQVVTRLALGLTVGMGICRLMMIAEAVLQAMSGARQMKQHIRFILLPLLHLCPRDHVDGEFAWLPLAGWRRRDAALVKDLTRWFGIPMILIALLVLPVVGIELFYAKQVLEWPWLQFAVETCGGFIWMAFVFEFVIMISVVPKKWKYCRTNWIDLAVVLLPLVSFMGAARLGRLVKLKQLTRTAKIYRMRGLALRMWRAIVALEVIDKILRRRPEQLAERLRAQIEAGLQRGGGDRGAQSRRARTGGVDTGGRYPPRLLPLLFGTALRSRSR